MVWLQVFILVEASYSEVVQKENKEDCWLVEQSFMEEEFRMGLFLSSSKAALMACS